MDFLSQLSPAGRNILEQEGHVVRVRKGQVVVSQGARDSSVYLIREGVFRVLIYSNMGKEVSIRSLGGGEIFGELAALDKGLRSANVVARSPGVLLQISGAAFRSLMESSPQLGIWLARYLSGQIRVLTNRIFELGALDVKSRIHCELLRLGLLAGVSYNKATVEGAPTHQELANRIGTHREAVTRELKELAQQGMVSYTRHKLHIHDVASLSSLARRANSEMVDVYSIERLPRSVAGSGVS
jgi:CRP/FNR family transcriptional regulator, cyclic AMP receptor protein